MGAIRRCVCFDLSWNKSQSILVVHFHAQYSLRGPLLRGRFGRAAGRMGSDNALVSLALSSEEGSNTSRMKTMAVYRFLTEIWDSNAAIA